jgi:glyoxylase-like metal-dependent hydrolase (beta-lactamase superfamily II)
MQHLFLRKILKKVQMKKIYKRIISGLAIFIVLLIILSVGYLLTARSIMKGMKTIETGETVKNVYSIKDSFVNIYLVKNGENYIAIDAGNNQADIQQELKKLTIDPAKVDAVLLTHSDADHVAGIRLFKNAVVYLSVQEEQMINGGKSRFFIFGNKIDTEKYSLIADNQIITIGNIKIQGFLTPGHTPGAMCYLVNDSLLFTGDALKLKNGTIEPFYRFFNMDSKTSTQSIGKIIRIPGVRYMFTAHNGYTDNFKNATKDWPLYESGN